MRVRTKRRYDEDFKRNSLELLERSDDTLHAVARQLKVNSATLGYWYKQDMAKRRSMPVAAAPPSETLEQRVVRLEQENAALRKSNEELRLDKEILKKAAAFFVRESK
jgi:transposase